MSVQEVENFIDQYVKPKPQRPEPNFRVVRPRSINHLEQVSVPSRPSTPVEDLPSPKHKPIRQDRLGEDLARQVINRQKARDAVVQDYRKRLLRECTPEEFESKGDLELAQLKREMEALEDKKAEDKNAIWLTVNAKTSVSFEYLKQQVEKYVNKKPYRNQTRHWCFERRWKDDQPNDGFHAHILITMPEKKVAAIKTETKNTFKDACDTTRDNCLYLRFIKLKDYDVKLNYIMGNKVDAKQEWVGRDRDWRTDNNIEQFYYLGPDDE